MAPTPSERKRARQARFLELVGEGYAFMEVCRIMGISRHTYQTWRREEPDFRAAVAALRDHVRGTEPSRGWDGTFASARQHFFGMETYYHQREIDHVIENAPRGEVSMVLVAPETGKTTFFEDKMSVMLGQNPNLRITYVTESQARTRKVSGRLQRRMVAAKDYEEFIRRFGPFYVRGQEREGKPWASDYFTVFRADHDERDYSFEGRGWRSAVAGTRCDLMVIDDVQSLRSLNQTADILDRLRQDFFSRPGREGKIVVVGTRVGLGDVYEALWEEGIVSERNTVRLPILDAEGRSLCPEMWSEEDLEKKRLLVGESAWWRNYMQKPQFAMDATFTPAMLEAAWDLRELGQSSLENRVAALDPALAGGNAIIVGAYDKARFEVLDIDYAFNLARVEEILVRIERLARQHGFDDLIVETNAYQRGLVHDERMLELSRRYGFRVRPHQTHHNKNDADLGVARMASSFVREEIRWPGTPDARDRLKPMFEQFTNWRPDTPTKRRVQDLVMAHWFAWLFWQERRNLLNAQAAPLLRTNRALPYPKTQLPTGPVRRSLVGMRR